ncbi:MAG: TIGR00282 family metallophosphoesterase [Candidatus Omnitrophica bacterium CG12_big_fil_rev_8_21_14_0_65_42_8]|nr:MAG: TIGR00282 family metallophosphoesterase [Candidatus Omnitrophica bacterium CG12_big_fil_rev_8_21_14_0_65_42_8]
MKILLIGDIVGSPGREAVKKIVPKLRRERDIDFVIANAENVAGGSGLTPETVDELLQNEVDVITSGDHVWKKKEVYERLSKDKRIIRPANYPETSPGSGMTVIPMENGAKIAVINLLGRVFMNPIDCPFTAAEREIGKINRETKIILVDMHAEATSEKIAMGRFLDGRVSVVFGTHTHVQTADEKIFPHGTGYITDLGMTGPQDSVIGRRYDAIVEHFLTCMPKKFEVADKDVELQGAIVNIDDESGKTLSIERVKEKIESYR